MVRLFIAHRGCDGGPKANSFPIDKANETLETDSKLAPGENPMIAYESPANK